MTGGLVRRVAVTDGEVALHEWPCTIESEAARRRPPVLMLHGVLSYSFIFEPLLPALTDGYCVLSPDLLGCGDSEKVEADLSVGAHAGRWRELLDELELERVHLVAHDVGGGIAQLMALDCPERLASLTLINPVGYDFWPVQAVEALRTPIIRQFVMASFDWGTLRAMVRHGLGDPGNLDEALFERFRMPFRTRAGRRSFLAFLRGLDAGELMTRAGELGRIETETLIVRGTRDRYLSEEITRRLAEDLPHARLEHLEGAGHFCMFDAPAALARLIREHIIRCDAADGARA